MDTHNRKLVLASSGALFSAKGRFAEAFYDRLFDLAPEVRALFRVDMTHQKRMLMAALAMVVGVLGDRERLAKTAADLGRVHAQRQVTAAHLDIGQQAFDLALQDFFGTDYTPELRAAWGEAFAELVTLMRLDEAAA
ncbi:Hemoglobin-like flavoprotein [Rhodovulum sp. ES.010]|uniref:globin domain-containing protein n=1 Tax=Rhodovulum sp. ES.010 TaxID=1882821 RepID=UPI0009284479|nr:globin domain-containing protein [Rhodovulum sp. ES.010]SIO42005.1 Hemoglobin-like flavoprotein [Rhodovulum sp. ES.010]